MVIHVYSIVRDEEEMLPYFLRHYSIFADKIFIIDDKSRDNTLKIARKNKKVKIFKQEFTEGFIESEHNNCFETMYKKYSRGVADWVIIADADEFVYHPNLIEILEKQKKFGVKIIKTAGYSMYSQIYPSTKGQIYEECKFGNRSHLFDKAIIFNPEIDISLGPGRHTTTTPGIRQHRAKILLLHFRYMSLFSSLKSFFKIEKYDLAKEHKLIRNLKIAIARYEFGVKALAKNKLVKVV